ncbi:MAG: hypothetical protein IJM62_03900 [Lachnospiraceae bacterium]|nr:hypothetical protein [Lachnospiraceae bacterium]
MKDVKINYKNLIRLIIILVVIIVLIIFLVKGCRGRSKSNTGGESGAYTSTEEEIQSLIERYYNARLTLNENALAEIYRTDSVMEIDIYRKMNEYISSVDGLKCYIRDGVSRDEYVVFVYSDLTLEKYDITIPNVTPVYVKTDDDGSLYIYPGDYSPSLMKYIYPINVDERIEDIATGDEEIKALLEETTAGIKKAAADNAGFRELYKKLTNANDEDIMQSIEDESRGSEETEPAGN